MAESTVYNQESKEAGKISLKDSVFGAPVQMSLLHDSVRNFLANRRRGTASTKTRGEVSGGGKKPWKQKGTGRARQGSTRAPQWYHGGITFGPKPRDYSYSLPAKVRHASLRSALSAKNAEGGLVVIEKFELAQPKTRQVAAFLKQFKAGEDNALLVLDKMNEAVKKSCRNVEKLALAQADSMHPYQILWAKKVFVTRAAVAKIEEGLS
jgi:large subunit ribosomal protein L4